jgi:very-short-patch-repair endonuclease
MPPQTLARRKTRTEHLAAWITQNHGVAHTQSVRAAGFSRYEIADAAALGVVQRVRRSWLVTPDCDPRRVTAASIGGRATCVTAAELYGLWVPEHDGRTHVAVPTTSSRHAAANVHLHWAVGPAPTGRRENVDPLLNVLFHVAQCLPMAEALAVWESAIRKQLVDPEVLRRVEWRRTAASDIAAVADRLSNSGLETHFAIGMRAIGVRVLQQVWVDGHPLDGLIGDSLAIQIDGFAHHQSAADRRRDLAADARLVARGYVVLRFDYYQVLFQWNYVVETIRTAMAQGAHRRSAPLVLARTGDQPRTGRHGRRIQAVSATPSSGGVDSSRVRASVGVAQLRVFRGR